MKTSTNSLILFSALLPSALGAAIPANPPPPTEIIPGVSVGGEIIKRDEKVPIKTLTLGSAGKVSKKAEIHDDGEHISVDFPGISIVTERGEPLYPNVVDIGLGDTIIKKAEIHDDDEHISVDIPGISIVTERGEPVLPNVVDLGLGDTIIKKSEMENERYRYAPGTNVIYDRGEKDDLPSGYKDFDPWDPQYREELEMARDALIPEDIFVPGIDDNRQTEKNFVERETCKRRCKNRNKDHSS